MWNFKKMDPAVRQQRQAEALEMVVFALRVCKVLDDNALGFCYEHPVNASSWNEPQALQIIQSVRGGRMVCFDQCAVGLVSPKGQPMKKRIRFFTNVLGIEDEFCAKQCTCAGGQHTRIQGSELGIPLSVHAQKYPQTMLRSLVACARQRRAEHP